MSKTRRNKQTHLQIICTPVQYPQLYQEARTSWDYHAIAPRYLLSRCPFCGVSYTSLVDTHTSNVWGRSYYGYSGKTFSEEDEGACEHYVQIQRFFNLEGIVPVERVKFGNVWHVPFVMPFYIPDDVPSAAVIHSLPICRIENDAGQIYNTNFSRFVEPLTAFLEWEGEGTLYNTVPFSEISAKDKESLKKAQFIPRYTGFAVTYYSLDPKLLIQRYFDSQDPDIDYPVIWASMEGIARLHPRGYDLADWVKKKKLYWLDLDSPKLLLKQGPIEDFPYDTDYFDVTGSLRGFRYDMGRVKLGNY